MEDMYAVRTLKGVVSLDRDIASAIKDVLDAVLLEVREGKSED